MSDSKHSINRSDRMNWTNASVVNVTDTCGLCANVSFGISVSIILMAVIGISLNTLSVFIFSRPAMRRLSINVLLCGLSCVDVCVLFCGIPSFGIMGLGSSRVIPDPVQENRFVIFVVYLTYPLALTAQTTSIWIFVLITVERFIAVWTPMKARILCTPRRAMAALLITGILCFVYNSPRYCEYSLVHNSVLNVSSPAPSPMRRSGHYISVYMTCMYLIFQFSIPFLLLSILSLLIVHKLRTARRLRRLLSNQTSIGTQDRGTSVMMLVLVLIFLCCLSLPMVLNFIEALHQGVSSNIGTTATSEYYVAMDFGNFLVIFRASSSAVIYYIFSQKYRDIATGLLCGRKPQDPVQTRLVQQHRGPRYGSRRPNMQHQHQHQIVVNGDKNGFNEPLL